MNVFRFAAFIFFATITATLWSAPAANRVGDFALLDQAGKFHQLSWYGDQKAVVIFVQANDEPLVRATVPRLQKLRDQYQQRGVVFFMLNPQDNRQSITSESQQHNYDIPVLVDEAQLVAESLGAQSIGEAFLVDPDSMSVLYRGPVDGDSTGAAKQYGAGGYFLQEAIDSALAAAPVAAPSAPLNTPQIAYQSLRSEGASQVSYRRDIVPILKDNCVSCHHDGGIGPWSMSSHAMVQGWSKMMREVVMTRRMPPGQIDSHVGKPILEMAGLTTAEKQMLVHWIDAGAPMDDNAGDPLAELSFNNPRYTLGEPDMVFKVPAQSIPATGVIDYRYVPVELNLDRDVWVRAMETVPGDRQVLHHVIAYLSSPADKTARGRLTGSARGESIGGFAPGRQADVFRDNSGRLITKGSNLLLQMHYTTSGKATVDETEIGLYLYDEPPAYIMAGGVAGQRRFLIPPHAKEHKLEGEQLIERDAYLYSLMPHMHFRGSYMNYTAEYPDGRSELLLSVPRYEFNWQFNYQLAEPLFLPAGTRLVARGAMDNSERNPANPDPSKPVHFGLQTKHEMFFGFTTLRYVGDTPQSLLADNPPDKKDLAGL